jgi:DNA-binding NarL/FixJ family response regulator
MKDIAIICLGKSNQHHDILELHFGPQFARKPALLNDILAHALADVYAGRREGFVVTALSGACRRATLSGTPCERSQPLLSLANPAGLTRMEWKVCALVANGLSREGVAQELCIKPSTVQTHLRNIYAKSGFERFHELALHLVSRQERIHLVSAKEEAAA